MGTTATRTGAQVDDVEALPSSPTPDELLAVLSELPEESDRSWELILTRLAERGPEAADALATLLDREEFDGGDDVQFAAFFAYCTYLRRQKNSTELERTLADYEFFADRPMYLHLRSLSAKLRGTDQDYTDSIDYARQAAAKVDGHAGVSHGFATAVVTAVEEGIEEPSDDLLAIAEEHLGIALRHSDYPKFYATRGRLHAIRGRFDRAKASVRRAMDKESQNKSDYAIRISDYQQVLMRIQLQEQMAVLETEVEETRAELAAAREESAEIVRSMQVRTLQFLGFFATLLAVIITSVQIATSFSVRGAATLMLVMTGGLLCAFGGFSTSLPDGNSARRGGLVFLAGLLVVGAGGALFVV